MYKSIVLILFSSFIISSCKNTQEKNDLLPAENLDQAVPLLADGKLRYLELSGTPYERGLTHGTLLKKEINEVIQILREDIKKVTKEDLHQFVVRFFEETDYKSFILKWMPELMEELRGISEGSGIDMETILLHQLGNEYWLNYSDILVPTSSSLGVDKSIKHSCYTAQNLDLPPAYHGYQTVLKITDSISDLKMLIVTIPGHLGMTGMNNKSVSIHCNTLLQLNNSKSGLPVSFIVRGVLAKKTRQEALKFLTDIKHASGQNYIIGGLDKVNSLEFSSNKIAEYRPFENAPFTFHTNHPKSNKDYSKKFLAGLKRAKASVEQAEEEEFRCLRIRSFHFKLNRETKDIDIEYIKRVLRSRGTTYDVISNENTFASVICELANIPKFFIVPGRPGKQNYIEIDFEKEPTGI